jgi:diaminohydroxyphosphoribosylaminopyrimidine deaminase/5-amino-6-(5-phosphoribosylamino)uracil reductase
LSERDGDRAALLQAIEWSRRAKPSRSAYSVGCVIADSRGDVIATGFSRERNERSHAEEVALDKALETRVVLRGATLYTSLEPCSVRRSGAAPCTTRILEAGIARVVFAMREPSYFVEGRGAEVLAESEVDVVEITALAPLAAEVNAHLVEP